MKVVVYRHLPEDGFSGFEYLGEFDRPDMFVVAPGIIPGRFGHKQIVIDHIQQTDFLLVTQTNETIPMEEKYGYAEAARQYLEKIKS